MGAVWLVLTACTRAKSEPVAEPELLIRSAPPSAMPTPLGPARASSSVPAPAPSSKPNVDELAERFDGKKAQKVFTGQAAFYSDSLARHPTASGEPYDPKALTGAHRHLPLGSVVRVIRVDNGLRVYVRINDRGPYGTRGRIIDLSRAAAKRLGMLHTGVAEVRVEVVRRPD